MISTPIHDELQDILEVETRLGDGNTEPVTDAGPDKPPARVARHHRA